MAYTVFKCDLALRSINFLGNPQRSFIRVFAWQVILKEPIIFILILRVAKTKLNSHTVYIKIFSMSTLKIKYFDMYTYVFPWLLTPEDTRSPANIGAIYLC